MKTTLEPRRKLRTTTYTRSVLAGLLVLLALAVGASTLVGCALEREPAPTPTKTRGVALIALQRATLVQATRVTYTPRPTATGTPRPAPAATELPQPEPIVPAVAPAPEPATEEVTLSEETAAAPLPTSGAAPPVSSPTARVATAAATAANTPGQVAGTLTATPSGTPSATPSPTITPLPTASELDKPDTARFYVYLDADSGQNHFSPAELEESSTDITFDQYYEDRPCQGSTGIEVFYFPSDYHNPDATAGMRWQEPASDAGTSASDGFDLSNYNKLVFCARGEAGNEQVKFGVGGYGRDGSCATRPLFPDSACPGEVRDITLTEQWEEYTIDLGSTDLSRVITGFFWEVQQASMPEGATFYLDNIRFEHR